MVYTTTTKIIIKPGSAAAVKELVQQAVEVSKTWTGTVGLAMSQVDENTITSVAAYDSKEDLEVNAPYIRQVLGGLAAHVAAPPDRQGGNVIAKLERPFVAGAATSVTYIKIQEGKKDAFLAEIPAVVESFESWTGLQSFFLTEISDTLYTGIATYESKAALEANSVKVAATFKGIGPLLGGKPERFVGDVILGVDEKPYSTTTLFKIKPGTFDELKGMAQGARDKIATFKGSVGAVMTQVDETTCISIATYDCKVNLDANAAFIRETLGAMAKHFAAKPDRRGGRVVVKLGRPLQGGSATSVTYIKVQEGKAADAVRFLGSLKEKVDQWPGLLSFQVTQLDATTFTGLATYESLAALEALSAEVKKVFGGMGPLMAAKPERHIGATFLSLDEDAKSSETQSTFLIEYSIPIALRGDVFANFGSMNEAADAQDRGNVKQIGRWHTGVGSGVAIVEGNALEVAAWCYNWASACEIKITPVFDDATTRKIIQTKAKAASA